MKSKTFSQSVFRHRSLKLYRWEVALGALVAVVIITMKYPWILAFPVAYVLWRHHQKTLREAAMLAYDMERLDGMKGLEFEQRLGVFFDKQGYRVKVTPGSRDHGIDLVIEKGGIRTAVQAKRYSATRKVGSPEVRNLAGSLKGTKCNDCLLITTTYFTKDAVQDAAQCGVGLWDRDELAKRIHAARYTKKTWSGLTKGECGR